MAQIWRTTWILFLPLFYRVAKSTRILFLLLRTLYSRGARGAGRSPLLTRCRHQNYPSLSLNRAQAVKAATPGPRNHPVPE